MAWPQRETSLLQALAHSHTHTHTHIYTHSVPSVPGSTSQTRLLFHIFLLLFPPVPSGSALVSFTAIACIHIYSKGSHKKLNTRSSHISWRYVWHIFDFFLLFGNCKMGRKHKLCQFHCSYHSYLTDNRNNCAGLWRMPTISCRAVSSRRGKSESL